MVITIHFSSYTQFKDEAFPLSLQLLLVVQSLWKTSIQAVRWLGLIQLLLLFIQVTPFWLHEWPMWQGPEAVNCWSDFYWFPILFSYVENTHAGGNRVSVNKRWNKLLRRKKKKEKTVKVHSVRVLVSFVIPSLSYRDQYCFRSKDETRGRNANEKGTDMHWGEREVGSTHSTFISSSSPFFHFLSPFAWRSLHYPESREFETSSPSPQSVVIAEKRTLPILLAPCSSLSFSLSTLSISFPSLPVLAFVVEVGVREMHSTDLSCISSVFGAEKLWFITYL